MTTTLDADDATQATELGAEIVREMIRKLRTSEGEDVAMLAARGAFAELARTIEFAGGLPALRQAYQQVYHAIAHPPGSPAAA